MFSSPRVIRWRRNEKQRLKGDVSRETSPFSTITRSGTVGAHQDRRSRVARCARPWPGSVKDVPAQIVYKKIVEAEPTTMHAHGSPPLKRADILVVIWLSLLI